MANSQLNTTQPVHEIIQPDEQESQQRASGLVVKWAGRLAGAALVAGGAAAYIANPIDHIDGHDALAVTEESVPYVIAGGVTETMWVGGAAIALGAAGKKVKIKGIKSNFRQNVSEFADDVYSSEAFKFGLRTNTIGAIGTAAVVGVAAVTKLPPEMWPGALGVAGLDMAGTLALRAPLYKGIHERAKSAETSKVSVRKARLDDIDRLADIDLSGFKGAYGENPPSKEEVMDMLTKRLANTSWMFVAEMNGQVEGFVSAFRTNKSADEFKSWADSTADGTLEGKVDPKGRYAYVTNMTINHEAVVNGAKDMLLANLFVEAIKEGGVEYGYFESRMPMFKRWLKKNNKLTDDEAELQEFANEYAELRREDGKRYDAQLRMYESDGFKLGKPIAGAFEDDQSMDFGVVCVAPVPTYNKFFETVKPARQASAIALRAIAKHPQLLSKVL